MSAEVLARLKELRDIASETEKQLEDAGISITNIQKEQLFNHNIKNIVAAIEGLLRNEPSERHHIRIEKEIPDSYANIKKLRETQHGRGNQNLEKLGEIISFFESRYREI